MKEIKTEKEILESIGKRIKINDKGKCLEGVLAGDVELRIDGRHSYTIGIGMGHVQTQIYEETLHMYLVEDETTKEMEMKEIKTWDELIVHVGKEISMNLNGNDLDGKLIDECGTFYFLHNGESNRGGRPDDRELMKGYKHSWCLGEGGIGSDYTNIFLKSGIGGIDNKYGTLVLPNTDIKLF